MATVCNGGFNSTEYPIESEYPIDSEYHIESDIFDDYYPFNDIFDQWSEKLSTIKDDVAKIASRSQDEPKNFNSDNDVKPEMRFGDLMWPSYVTPNSMNNGSANNSSNNSSSHNNSNSNNNINTTNSAASSYSESSAVSPAIVSGNLKSEIEDEDDNEHDQVNDNDHDDENCNDSNNNKNNKTISSSNKLCTFATSARIAIRKPNNSSSNYNTNAKTVSNNSAEEHIPPGASLLRKSQNNSYKIANSSEMKSHLYKCHMQMLASANKSSSSSSNNNNNANLFDDDVAPSVKSSNLSEFRHTVDLRACVMGSNNISLTNLADASYIDHISRELQNTSKNRIDMLTYDQAMLNIGDVLEVINQQNGPATTTGSAAAAAATTLATGSTTILDDDDDLLLSGNCSSGVVNASLTPAATNSECDSDDGDCSMVDSSCGSTDNGNIYTAPYMRHSDHSYTRNEMETNLETPSDSDEEIDVVSLNDKKLPTNPSDRDRRALQTKVANKISTLPPPRRGRYELPYTPASSSPVKSEANSRFPSPSSTPYQSTGAVSTVYSPFVSRNSSGNSSSSSSTAGSECATTTPSSQLQWESKCRKRFYVNDAQYRIYSIKGNQNKASSNSSSSAPSAKKSRVKKVITTKRLISGDFPAYPVLQVKQEPQSTLGANNGSSASSSSSSSGSSSSGSSNSSMLKRQFSLDEADTIEKRNLHNDMERQRRIGLKNLFEALKKQIPNIRDKERAPKVNILREAAKLCEQLTSEERELSLKRQLLKARQNKLQELIARQRMSKNAAE